MPVYAYQAVNALGKKVKGTTRAPCEEDLARVLQEQQLWLTHAAPRSEKREASRFRGKLPPAEIIQFTHHLAIFYDSGISILDGLEDLTGMGTSEDLRRLCQELAAMIREGSSLSQALACYPRNFPDAYVAVVRAGEITGELDKVMRKLAGTLEWSQQIKGQAKQAFIYPCVLFTAVIGLVIFLFTFLLPRILKIYTESSVELPGVTKALLAVSGFCVGALPAAGVLAVVLLGTVLWLRRSPEGRLRLDRVRFGLPLLGDLFRKIGAARFVSTFATLHGAGVALQEAMRISGTATGSALLDHSVRKAVESVEGGESIAGALRRTGDFHPLVCRMVGVGESTGRLEEAMEHVLGFLDREVPQTVKRILSFLEPAMLLFAGGVVAFAVFGSLLPIFRLTSALKG